MGSIFGRDQKAYQKWARSSRRAPSHARGLTGMALESAVMRIAAQFPNNVIRGMAL